MLRFITLTFAFLGWGFYELSGGGDFEPAKKAEAPVAVTTPEPETEEQSVLQFAAVAPEPMTDEVKVAALTQPVTTTTDATPAVLTDAVQPSEQRPATQSNGSFFTALAKPTQKTVRVETASADADSAADEIDDRDLRRVSKSRVNMRNGPGRNHSVVAKLAKGTDVEVLQDPGTGWVKLRVIESKRVGWMADFLLVASN